MEEKEPILEISDSSVVEPKLPPPIVVSAGLAAVLTMTHILVQFVGDSYVSPIASIIFFCISMLIFYVSLNRILFRKLNELNTLTQKEIKKLKELETYRREFLGEVSHELKTPIFAIQGFIHTLIDGAMDDDRVREKFLRKAMKNSDRLSNLVEDLLVITQAESGEMEIRIRKFSICELITDVTESLEYKFKRKDRDISLVLDVDKHLETSVLADRERVLQVLTNLIENAVKYGDPQGTVSVSVSQKDDKILLAVKDDGPGIAQDHLSKIFRRFYRVDKSRSREKGGTGLGLAICKHLISAHGEQIWVESELNKGTTFFFTLKRDNDVPVTE